MLSKNRVLHSRIYKKILIWITEDYFSVNKSGKLQRVGSVIMQLKRVWPPTIDRYKNADCHIVILSDWETWQKIQVTNMTEVNEGKIQNLCVKGISNAGNISLWPNIKVFCVMYYMMFLSCVECMVYVWKHPASLQLQGNSAYYLHTSVMLYSKKLCKAVFLLREKYQHYHCIHSHPFFIPCYFLSWMHNIIHYKLLIFYLIVYLY